MYTYIRYPYLLSRPRNISKGNNLKGKKPCMPVDTHFKSTYTKHKTFKPEVNNDKINFSKLFNYLLCIL